MIRNLISEVSILRMYFEPWNLRIYDLIIIQVSQSTHMIDTSGHLCHRRIAMVQMDKKDRRKFCHNSHIHWDISVCKNVNIREFSLKGCEHFSNFMYLNLMPLCEYLQISVHIECILFAPTPYNHDIQNKMWRCKCIQKILFTGMFHFLDRNFSDAVILKKGF